MSGVVITGEVPDPEEFYRLALETLLDKVSDSAALEWSGIKFDPEEGETPEETQIRVKDAIFRSFQQINEEYWDIGTETAAVYLQAKRNGTPLEDAEIVRAFYSTDKTLWDKTEEVYGLLNSQNEKTARAAFIGRASNMIARASNKTVKLSVKKAGTYWVRVPESGACDWCIQISLYSMDRLYGYSSEHAAKYTKDGSRYHPNCRCAVVEVSGNNYNSLPSVLQEIRDTADAHIRQTGKEIDPSVFKKFWEDREARFGVYRKIGAGKPLSTDDEAVLEKFLRLNRGLPIKDLAKAGIQPEQWYEILIKYSPKYRDRKDHVLKGNPKDINPEILEESKHLKLDWQDIFVNTWGRLSKRQKGRWLGAHLFQYLDKIAPNKTVAPITWSSQDLFYATFATLKSPLKAFLASTDKTRKLQKEIDEITWEVSFYRKRDGQLKFKHNLPLPGNKVIDYHNKNDL